MIRQGLLAVSVLIGSACVTDLEEEGSVSQAEVLDPGGGGTTIGDARDPRVPRYPGLRTARIDLDIVNPLFVARLTGTKISIDATNTAPGIWGGETYQECTRGELYEEARELCLTIPTGRVACLRQAARDYPPVCEDIPILHHSYLAFPSQLKAAYPSVTDYLTDVDTARVGTWAGDVDITLNRISAELDGSNTFIYAGGSALDPYIALRIRAGSGQPTVYCRHTGVLTCPNLELTNMAFTLKLNLRPSVFDATRVGFGSIDTVFSFDRNVTNVPDWLVDAFWDVDARIRQRTEARVRDALSQDARHDMVERALHELVKLAAQASDATFTGFGVIDEVTQYGGDLYVHYYAP